MSRFALPFAIALASVALIGCGGGGGDGAEPSAVPQGRMDPAAEGVYGGSLSGGVGSDFQMLVLEDGTIWALYGVQGATQFSVINFVQGLASFAGGNFISNSTKDFRFAPAVGATANGTYTSSTHTISGTLAFPGSTVAFNGGPIPESSYDYNSPANVSTIAGAWPLTLLTGESASINVSNTGAIGGTSSGGCSFSGSVAPRGSGKNVFNLTLRFGPAPCALPNQTATGIAVSYLLSNGKRQLIALATDSTRTYGTGAFGLR